MVVLAKPGSYADEPPSMLGGATPEQEFIFLAGAAQGIGYTNAALRVYGKPQLYCAPSNFILNVETMRFAALQELTGPHEPSTFIHAALSWLEETYPCT
jgi:hypothetical protein